MQNKYLYIIIVCLLLYIGFDEYLLNSYYNMNTELLELFDILIEECRKL